MALEKLPQHLERYVVSQDYDRYTPIDQAVWRHILRQLKSFLSTHAHPCYIDGLEKTGIDLEQIPRIELMNEKLAKFGWQAVPVSGFIPPAAFMELQSLGVLPIASDMRSLDHLLYTPAPDIVHEAAGHAPILIDPAFADYLKSYALVARKAILSKEDMDQYEAIRILSDIKEDPGSTPSQIRQSEEKLATVNANMKHVSEAAILGRMNWWTAEYGLIGEISNPKIFGAGLLSSVGESRSAMSAKVKKIPLTIECIDFSYDITEQQPQLFVVPTFEKLSEVLDQLSKTMAYRQGGSESLEKAVRAETVNTIQLDSGLQISGVLKSYRKNYLSFEGPTQLAHDGTELPGQGVDHHRHGFGSPIGRVAVQSGSGPLSSLTDLSKQSETEIKRLGIEAGKKIRLQFESGVVVTGLVQTLTFSKTKKLLLITLKDARAEREGDILFDPAWGIYDMAIGSEVVSVYGGPADRTLFGETDDFTKKTIPRRTYEDGTLRRHSLYDKVRTARKLLAGTPNDFSRLVDDVIKLGSSDWLAMTDLLHVAEKQKSESAISKIRSRLSVISKEDDVLAQHISDAMKSNDGK